MSAVKPYAVHDVPNGWTIEEYESASNLWLGPDLLGNSQLGRYTARFRRVPSQRTVRIFHFQGTTPSDRHKSLTSGSAIARGKVPPLPWTRKRMKNGRNWYFTVLLGEPIQVAEEFARMTSGLDLANDESCVQEEFQRLMEEVLK